MLGRVRESLFAILGDVVEDAVVLDLFSGAGSLGLEALSRGAARVRFFERDRRAAARLDENVQILGVADRTTIVRGDALDAQRWSAGDPAPWADLVLLDPPYPMFDDGAGRRRLIASIAALTHEVLLPAGVLVLHTHPRVHIERELPEGPRSEQRVYGTTALWFLWKPAELAEPSDSEESEES